MATPSTAASVHQPAFMGRAQGSGTRNAHFPTLGETRFEGGRARSDKQDPENPKRPASGDRESRETQGSQGSQGDQTAAGADLRDAADSEYAEGVELAGQAGRSVVEGGERTPSASPLQAGLHADQDRPLEALSDPAGPEKARSDATPPDAASHATVALAIDRFRSETARLAEEARSDALQIGLSLARRILGLEISARVEPLIALVRSAIAEAGAERVLELHLPPDDLERIERHLEANPHVSLATAELKLVADPELGPGDCLVVTNYGHVDGSMETRIERLWQALIEEGTIAP